MAKSRYTKAEKYAPRFCEFCGAWLQRKRHPIRGPEQWEKYLNRRHCGITCASRKTVAEFWEIAHKSGDEDCWLWSGAINKPGGYGRITWNGKKYRTHRLAWELSHGVPPEGLHVLHSCDNPLCCNPAHLFLGTHQDNMSDCVRKGRQARLSGERCGMHKLTAEQVEYIRKNPSVPATALGKQFGVDPSTVRRVRRGCSWKDGAGGKMTARLEGLREKAAQQAQAGV